MNAVALVPARSGSRRIADKNIKPLGGHPLLAYSIAAARQSGIFDGVYVSTDSKEYAAIARDYGAKVVLRPIAMAKEDSPDYQWVEFTLRWLWDEGHQYNAFSILRPTSPFRMPETIQRAWDEFSKDECDSLRAVERVSQHPGKMWTISGNRMHPLIGMTRNGTPWHSCQSQSLPAVYVQNASLEIAWTETVWKTKTIAGDSVRPFFTRGHEGFDINSRKDWVMAEIMVRAGVPMPEVR